MIANAFSKVGRSYSAAGYSYSTLNNGGIKVRGLKNLQALPADAHIYAWATIRNGRFFTYGGRTSVGLHARLMCPNSTLGYSTVKMLNKATSDGYHTRSFAHLGGNQVFVFKSSAKDCNGENEQQVINALWQAQRYVAEKYGRKNLMFNLNTQAEHRTLEIDQRTFDECVKLFELWIESESKTLALKAKTAQAQEKAKAFITKTQAIMA